MLPESIREITTVRWMLALVVVALAAFTGGVFYSYITDPGITADDGSGDDVMDDEGVSSQVQANEDESGQEESIGPPGFPKEGTVVNGVTVTREILEGKAPIPPELIPNLADFIPTPESLPKLTHEEFYRQAIEEGAIITYASGPETAGGKLDLSDGTIIQLPEDAYIDKNAATGGCGPVGDEVICVEAPVYRIIRGNSEISFDANGLFWEITEPGHEDAFDFLKEVIPINTELWEATKGGRPKRTEPDTLDSDLLEGSTSTNH